MAEVVVVGQAASPSQTSRSCSTSSATATASLPPIVSRLTIRQLFAQEFTRSWNTHSDVDDIFSCPLSAKCPLSPPRPQICLTPSSIILHIRQMISRNMKTSNANHVLSRHVRLKGGRSCCLPIPVLLNGLTG